MDVIVRLTIFTVNMQEEGNQSIYICTKEPDKIPSQKLKDNQEVLDCVKELLYDTCSVTCLDHEYVMSEDIVVKDNQIIITYAVIVPYRINNNNNKRYNLLRAIDLIESGETNARDSNIIRGLLYKA